MSNWKPLTADEKMQRLGEIGEKLILNFESAQGNSIYQSIDPYDSEQDILVDGKRCEIKTQVPFFKRQGFTFKANQVKKLKNVDRIYFVSVPCNSFPEYADLTGKVYIIDNPMENLKIGTTPQMSDGRIMNYVRIADLKPYFIIDNPFALELLKRYSVSEEQ